MLVINKCKEIFTKINNDDDILIFDTVETSNVDKLYIFRYGSRRLNKIAENSDMEDIIDIAKTMYKDKWNNYYLNIVERIPQLSEYYEVIKETITNEGTIASNKNNINTVSAYNTENFLNDTNTANTESTDTETLKVRELQIEKVKDSKFYIELSRLINNSSILDIMFNDINSLITIEILN